MRLLAKIYEYGGDLNAVLDTAIDKYNSKKKEDPSIEFEDIQVLQTTLIDKDFVASVLHHVVLVYKYDERAFDRYIGDNTILRNSADYIPYTSPAKPETWKS